MARRAEIPKKRQGFTLIEVMVTLTILGFILIIIFGVFRMGLSAWEKGESSKEEYQKLRILSQLISQQIKSTVPYQIKSQKEMGDFLAFEGSAHSLKFVSALSLKARQPEGFVYIIYNFKEGGREGGYLNLYEERALNKNFMDNDPSEESWVPLFEGVTEVRFEYYREEDLEKNQDAGWVEEWDAREEKALPRALRMTLIHKEGEKEKEELPITILATLPSYQLEAARIGPFRRMVPQAAGGFYP